MWKKKPKSHQQDTTTTKKEVNFTKGSNQLLSWVIKGKWSIYTKPSHGIYIWISRNLSPVYKSNGFSEFPFHTFFSSFFPYENVFKMLI